MTSSVSKNVLENTEFAKAVEVTEGLIQYATNAQEPAGKKQASQSIRSNVTVEEKVLFSGYGRLKLDLVTSTYLFIVQTSSSGGFFKNGYHS